MKRNNKKGFTIVELVIVIAVIAILSAVLIPTFSGITNSAQEKADQATARNEYTQYMSDMDNLDDTVDYVLVKGVYYDVNDSFEPIEGTPVAGKYVLDGATDTVSAYPAPAVTPDP